MIAFYLKISKLVELFEVFELSSLIGYNWTIQYKRNLNKTIN